MVSGLPTNLILGIKLLGQKTSRFTKRYFFPQGAHNNNQTCTVSLLYACLVYSHRLKLWTMETVLVWSCIISLIVIVGIPFQNVHRVIFKLLKIPWSCVLEGKFIEKKSFIVF